MFCCLRLRRLVIVELWVLILFKAHRQGGFNFSLIYCGTTFIFVAFMRTNSYFLGYVRETNPNVNGKVSRALCWNVLTLRNVGWNYFLPALLSDKLCSWWRQKRISEYLAKRSHGCLSRAIFTLSPCFYVNLFRSIAKAFKLNQKLNFLRLLWNSPRVDWWNLNQKSPRRGKEAGVSEWFIGVQIGCGKIECCFTTLFRNLEPRARKCRQKFFQLIKKMFAMNCFSCEIFLLCGLLHSPSRGCVNSFNSMINLKRGRLKVKLKGSKGGVRSEWVVHCVTRMTKTTATKQQRHCAAWIISVQLLIRAECERKVLLSRLRPSRSPPKKAKTIKRLSRDANENPFEDNKFR